MEQRTTHNEPVREIPKQLAHVIRIRNKFLLSVAVLGVGAFVVAALAWPRLPRYNDRSIQDWLRTLPNNYPSWNEHTNEAQQAVRMIGSNAVPYLVRLLRARDPALIEKIKTKLDFYPTAQRLYRHAWQDRIDALKAVAVIGPPAAKATPEISKLLREGFETQLCVTALRSIGSQAVPALIQALACTNNMVRFSVVGSLTAFRQQAEVIVPALVGYLHDPDPIFRAEVISSLRYFAPYATVAVPSLLDLASQTNDPNARCQAVQTLYALDPEGSLRAFIGSLEATEPITRTAAAENLGWIKQGGTAAIPSLLRHLDDPDETVRASSALALGRIGEESEIVIPALLGTLAKKDLLLSMSSALALADFGERATNAVPVLKRLINENNTNQTYSAKLREALNRMERRSNARSD